MWDLYWLGGAFSFFLSLGRPACEGALHPVLFLEGGLNFH